MNKIKTIRCAHWDENEEIRNLWKFMEIGKYEKPKNKRIFKIIALALIQAFLVLDITWGGAGEVVVNSHGRIKKDINVFERWMANLLKKINGNSKNLVTLSKYWDMIFFGYEKRAERIWIPLGYKRLLD
ncbi:MAG: hypothetical protein L6416_10960 [Candidatus Omnitrophica bacterium]|nr:hypothetical protein [Candidatus Omnitrophota bacterium]